MSDQLVLLDHHPRWRLDATTRKRGRQGVAAARAVLREAQARVGAARPADSEDLEDPPPLAPAA